MENGSIFFGTVVDVADDKKLYRIRVKINGYTDKIAIEDLPWYYPFFGMKYLPIKNDVLSVTIFNGNFSTGFYHNKVDLKPSELSDKEYENYLEIYNRLGVSLTYKESTGIEFINDKAKIQIEKEKASILVDGNQIVIIKNRIDLGSDGEATPLGDKTVDALTKMIELTDSDFESILGILALVKNACSSPILAPIRLALTIKPPTEKIKHSKNISTNKTTVSKIQSKKTFIE
jgi:hypothetical protein